MTPLRVVALGSTLALGTAGAAPAPRLTTPAVHRPEARAGPYRVLVEQVTASDYLQELLERPSGRPATTGRRSAHLQLRLVADSPEAAAAVELFAIQSMTVAGQDGEAEVPHYGGPLENADNAVLRAYVYAGDIGTGTHAIRALGGEITAFERAEEIHAELPLDPGASVTVRGTRFVVSECSARDGLVAVRLLGHAPTGSQLLAATLEGTYGIDLLTSTGESAAPAGSTLGTTAEGDAEFNLAFQAPRAAPIRLRLRALLRSGARHTYPFRIEGIPLPERPARGTH